MSRSTLIYLVIAGAAYGAACNRSGVRDGGADRRGQDHADRRRPGGGRNAAAEIQGAQAAAQAKISSAQADFATTREDYRHGVQSDLDRPGSQGWTTCDAKARTANGAVKTRLSATLPELRRQRAAFVRDLHAIDNETADTWDAAKARLEKELAELKDAVERAE